MKAREQHVPIDRLTALALVTRAPRDLDTSESSQDDQALAHVAGCSHCAKQLEQLTIDSEELRAAAFAVADDLFDDAKLEAQRSRIMERIANLGRAARVLRFPAKAREAAMPAPTGSRRWISVAAAAGLIIGLVAGQLVHFMPWEPGRAPETAALQVQPRSANPLVIPVSSAQPLTDDELLDEIEAAVQLRRASSLRALDALTPTASDFRDLSVGR